MTFPTSPRFDYAQHDIFTNRHVERSRNAVTSPLHSFATSLFHHFAISPLHSFATSPFHYFTTSQHLFMPKTTLCMPFCCTFTDQFTTNN
ncbi:MAG: hypothetical protein IPN94_24435 [Sphingobacteriales bacterium]|nr:hypothetical protein [Sphingobacteriales bacterium]